MKKIGKRILSTILAVATLMSCWVWMAPEQSAAAAANEEVKDHYLFAYFTGTSKEGQTIHLAVSEDGYNYTALRGNDPVLIPSKGVGCVRDPYIWYNQNDDYYYILATDLDFTDGGGTYSNNSQSFIIWRSKDLVNWYDETMIDVSAMSHLIGDTTGMTAVWAPQVLWDGSSYVVYFTLACASTSWFDIVYLKTTDLLDQNAYYEFDYILGNGTGNGTDNGYGVIDADIIHNPGDGKYYLFYKTECNGHEMGSTATGTSLKTIHYYVGDSPTGPFTNPGDTKWSNAGFSVFPNYNVSLEGCNAFWDNDGNLLVYADEFEHTDVYGNAQAYFHIAKSNGNDFTSWTYPDVSKHNINSLSPRHGSVVKITEEEYNFLLDNSYRITSSSFPVNETLEDHLVGQFFTTSDPKENAASGYPDLDSVNGITMTQMSNGSYVADFNQSYATIDLKKLFPEGLSYKDGFSITFKAKTPSSSASNVRIYEIADIPGKRTGAESYTHFSPRADGNGVYVGSYYGPGNVREGKDVNTNDWKSDIYKLNRADDKWHEYMISYANGNYILYIDGQVAVMANRFTTAVTLDEGWYDAIGKATMYIGRSGFRQEYNTTVAGANDPDFTGQIRDLCVYDVSLSYYNFQDMDAKMKGQLDFIDGSNYTGITSSVPSFSAGEAIKSDYYSNILYAAPVTGAPWGNTVNANPTYNLNAGPVITYASKSDVHVGVYYAQTAIMLYDGVNDIKLPVMVGGRISNKDSNGTYLYKTYPVGFDEIYLPDKWAGYKNDVEFNNCMAGTSYVSHNASTTAYRSELDDGNSQDARYIQYYANIIQIDKDANIDFGRDGYKEYADLDWQIELSGDVNYSARCAVNGEYALYVIDFSAITKRRLALTKSEYDRIMNGDYCQPLKEKYADAVFTINTLDPRAYDFSANPKATAAGFARQIRDAINAYDTIVAVIADLDAKGLKGHQSMVTPAREATCQQTGLSEGEVCSLCSEVLKEQEITATRPHTFGEKFTDTDGKLKIQCSVCGTKVEYQAYEVRYENLFSFSLWSDSDSALLLHDSQRGSIQTDFESGTIKITNTNQIDTNPEVYTRTSGSTSRDFTYYTIPVEYGETYVLEFTTSGVQGEVFVFKYDKNGKLTGSYGDTSVSCENNTVSREFTVESNTAYIELRFDANSQGTVTFSNIGIYSKESYDSFASQNDAPTRVIFYPDDIDANNTLMHPSLGNTVQYEFFGWYTKSGIRYERYSEINTVSTLLYGRWIPAGMNVMFDNLFSFADWVKSSCNQLWYGDIENESGVTRLVTRDGISTNSVEGSITITNDEDPNTFARTNYWFDNGNIYKMTLEQNTNYILEYTASSDDGARQSACLYLTGGTAQYPETGNMTRYSTGTHYIPFNTGTNNTLTLRFDNLEPGTTLTISDIAVYREDFLEAATTITNREYRRYYEKSGVYLGDLYEYIPERPGFQFDTWMADLATAPESYVGTNFKPDGYGDYDCDDLDVTTAVAANYHVYSTWTENDYTVKFNTNTTAEVTGDSTSDKKQKYTADVTMPKISRKGYTFLGWADTPNGIAPELRAGGSVDNRLCGDPNGEVTLYGRWSANQYNMTFDNLIDFAEWKTRTPSNAKASEWTDTGFTLTSNNGAGEGTFSSPFFPVEPGKQYKVSFDYEESTIGTGVWDVYIFFCNENGGWVNFADGPSNRYSSNGSTKVDPDNAVFTAPTDESVVKAQIRVDANGSNTAVRFDNIRVYENKLNPITYTDVQNKYVTYDSAYPSTAMKPSRDGYDFQGWYYNNSARYYDGSGNRTIDGVVDFVETRKLNSQWKLNDTALDDDTYVVDFGATAVFDPIANDTIFTNEAKNQNTGYTVSFGTNSEFTDADGKVKFAPAEIIRSAKSIAYNAYLDTDTNTKLNSTINVIPASNVLYEENVLGASATGKVAWTNDGTTSGNTQSTSTEELYGYDAMYVNATGNHSNGSAKMTTVSSSNNRSETLTFTFTGTGFELYGACGNNTGVQVIAVRDSSGNLVKSAVVDTYYNDSYGTLYQTPIYNVSGLGYGTYTVEVTAAYLSMAGALKAQSAEVFGTLSTNDNELADALAEVGLDYILEAEDVDVEWFDDESILNGGTGANDPTAFGTQSVTSLVNYVDAVRVFEPLAEADENTHYIDSEQNARYYNINDNLMSKSGFIAGGKGFVYIEGNNNFGFDAEDYNSKGSKHEIYLTNASQGENALVFSVSGAGGYNKAMLSLRSATGGDIKVKIGGKELTVSSKTDMYYDITDYVNSDGTVTIENATANSLLAIGYLKLTGQAVLETTSDLSSAIEMIETPLDGEEITTGAITNVEYTPSTDSHNTFNVTVNGRPTMIQFIEEDGGTRTYDRNNENVAIKSYNADGVEVNSLDRTVAYEVWTINTNLTGPEVKARAKFITDGAYKWEKNPYSFTYEILEPVLDADVRSITPAAVSGKKGAVEVKVVTGPDAQGVRFVMPDGSTCTYNATKAVTLENGDLEFTGKAWMNEDGLNTISVYIRENNVWNSVGTIEYTAE